jgi:FAD/FMN-containing dehydrogenase
LRCYPSTLAKATVGGFLAGGSGGIGSIKHGGLRDFQTVRAIEVVTMEDEPRVVLHEGEAVHEIMHAWGTNGIITKIWLALAPAVEWAQFVAAFDTFAQAYAFAKKISDSDAWDKRLAAVFEWPVPSYFTPIPQTMVDGKSTIFFMIARTQVEALLTEVLAAGGTVPFKGNFDGPRTQPLLSDYTWNHTTLWAMKANPELTYLQCGFSPESFMAQFAHLKESFPGEIFFHLEFMKNGEGVIVPGSIPLVKYTTEERLNEIIEECGKIGVFVANPHINNVEGGGRFRQDQVQLKAKYKYDPHGLLNPGKMVSFQKEEVAQ